MRGADTSCRAKHPTSISVHACVLQLHWTLHLPEMVSHMAHCGELRLERLRELTFYCPIPVGREKSQTTLIQD